MNEKLSEIIKRTGAKEMSDLVESKRLESEEDEQPDTSVFNEKSNEAIQKIIRLIKNPSSEGDDSIDAITVLKEFALWWHEEKKRWNKPLTDEEHIDANSGRNLKIEKEDLPELFEKIWQATKHWDLDNGKSVGENPDCVGYAGMNGDDVWVILTAISGFTRRDLEETQATEEELEDKMQSIDGGHQVGLGVVPDVA